MKDYGLRRPSFTSSLAGLASLGGLTALAEEESWVEEEEEAEAKDDQLVSKTQSVTLNKELRGSDVLPPIAQTPSLLEQKPQVSTGYAKSQKEALPIALKISAKGRVSTNGPKKTQVMTKVHETQQKHGSNISPSDANQTRRRKFSLVTASRDLSPSGKGFRGSENTKQGVLLGRRHSTGTDQPDTRYERQEIYSLHHQSSNGGGYRQTHRPRAQTWHNGRDVNMPDFSRDDGTVPKQKAEEQQASTETRVLTENQRDSKENATEVGDDKLDVQQGIEQLGTDGEHSDIYDALERPGNRRGRRWSRPDFAETSRRVSMLLRAARGSTRKGERKLSLPDWHLLEDDCPKIPRFSSFMSAEAQFALMQGYEDRLVEWLKQKFPGYKGLRRSSTPGEGVDIRRVTLRRKNSDDAEDDFSDTDSFDDDDDDDDDGNNDDSDSFADQSPRQIYLEDVTVPMTAGKGSGFYLTESSNVYPPHQNAKCKNVKAADAYGLSQPIHSSSLPSFSNTSSPQYAPTRKYSRAYSIASEPPEVLDSKTALRSLRRLSNPLTRRDFNVRRLFGDEDPDEEDSASVSHNAHGLTFPLRRHGSLPTVSYELPSERRLAMTRRLENAMDILDSLRAEQGDPTLLSPRAKVRQGRVAPLSDYNTWVSQWNLEFRIPKEKA